MTPRQRMITALKGQKPDRLPVTTHHVMPYFLNKYLDGRSNDEFFSYFGFDPIYWTVPLKPDTSGNGYRQNGMIVSDHWQVCSESIPDSRYTTVRYHITTPKGKLSMTIQSNEYTSWVCEHLIKNPNDIELLANYLPKQLCDTEAVNSQSVHYGQTTLIRGHIPGFDLSGQPGCWQDACCLVGTEKLIMSTYDDPEWVHELVSILQKRKLAFIESLKGAEYDVLELGGGDASTTVISPQIFHEFVAPYDSTLIEAAHQAGQRIVYHICGGKMPILEDIAAMKPDAVETFTPPEMGGDTNLAEAKRRIGSKVCMIGGFDQGHYFTGCTPEETRRAVRKCFEEAGEGGGFILAPSDHFFDSDVELIKAFVDEAHKCVY
jgi:uroporphyrinogen decarboxylase